MPSRSTPGDTKFGLKALAKIAFGLRIQVNALGDVHRVEGSLRLMLSGLGCETDALPGMAASNDFRCVVFAGREVVGVSGEGRALSECGRAQRSRYRR